MEPAEFLVQHAQCVAGIRRAAASRRREVLQGKGLHEEIKNAACKRPDGVSKRTRFRAPAASFFIGFLRRTLLRLAETQCELVGVTAQRRIEYCLRVVVGRMCERAAFSLYDEP